MGPAVTRGVLLEVLGQKLAASDDAAIGEPAANGEPVLPSNYRITIEDLDGRNTPPAGLGVRRRGR